jgi:MFS family permease
MPRLSLLTYSLGFVLLCYGLVVFMFGPCLTAMAATFDVPLARLGLIFTAFSVGLIPSVLCVGYVSELAGKRLILLVSLLLTGTGCALFAAVSSMWTPPSFLLAMGTVVLMGIGGGGIEVLTNALIADENQPSPGFALNVTHVFFAIGAVLGPVGAGTVMRAELPCASSCSRSGCRFLMAPPST